jgi:hypothetical protein
MKRKHFSVCLIVLAALGTAIVGNSYRLAGTPTSAAATETAEASVASQSPTYGPIRNLRFTLFDAGIRPNEMRIKAGLVNILIEDRTHMAESVTIQRVTGPDRVVGEVKKAVNQSRGRNLFRLTPGEYELFEPIRPENKALLSVEQ